MIRPLEQQFEPEKVQRIRELKELFQSLPNQSGAAKYFMGEITRCLETGLLLAAVEVATSCLELIVRDLLIAARCESNISQPSLPLLQSREDQIEREIEDVERLYFNEMVDELTERRVISRSDANTIKDFYKTVRVPIHHGLTRRFIRISSDVAEDEFWAELSLGRRSRFHNFEKVMEEDSIRHLSTIVAFMGKHCEGTS